MDELNIIRMQEFAIKAEEGIDAQKHIFAYEVAEELRRREVNNLYSKLHTQSLK